MRYALNRWDGLTAFLDDGRIELDNNAVERGMRPIIALGRKNHLFAGGDGGAEHWAISLRPANSTPSTPRPVSSGSSASSGKRRMADLDELLPLTHAVQQASVGTTPSAAA